MTGKLNNARNSTVLRRKHCKTHLRKICIVNASSVSWTTRVKPNLTVYNKLLCKNKGPFTVSDDQVSVGWRWENVEFSFLPIPFPSMKLA